MRNNKFIKFIFEDKKGSIVLGQKPNVPLIIWIACIPLLLITSGELQNVIQIISFWAILIWACLELFMGSNLFRRLLGLIIFGFLIYSKFKY